ALRIARGEVAELNPAVGGEGGLRPFEPALVVLGMADQPAAAGQLVFDGEGRLAGFVDFADPRLPIFIALPAEYLSAMGTLHWVDMLARALPPEEAAPQILTKMRERRPHEDDVRLYCAAADALLTAGRTGQAAVLLQRAIALSPSNEWALQ